MMAPSILASSLNRWGVNSASSRKPPEQMLRTSGPSPTTMSAPLLAWSIRSRPSRSGVPGATAASASVIAALRGTTRSYLPRLPGREYSHGFQSIRQGGYPRDGEFGRRIGRGHRYQGPAEPEAASLP